MSARKNMTQSSSGFTHANLVAGATQAHQHDDSNHDKREQDADSEHKPLERGHARTPSKRGWVTRAGAGLLRGAEDRVVRGSGDKSGVVDG